VIDKTKCQVCGALVIVYGEDLTVSKHYNGGVACEGSYKRLLQPEDKPTPIPDKPAKKTLTHYEGPSAVVFLGLYPNLQAIADSHRTIAELYLRGNND
jgi:hypothetical protein